MADLTIREKNNLLMDLVGLKTRGTVCAVPPDFKIETYTHFRLINLFDGVIKHSPASEFSLYNGIEDPMTTFAFSNNLPDKQPFVAQVRANSVYMSVAANLATTSATYDVRLSSKLAIDITNVNFIAFECAYTRNDIIQSANVASLSQVVGGQVVTVKCARQENFRGLKIIPTTGLTGLYNLAFHAIAEGTALDGKASTCSIEIFKIWMYKIIVP